MIVLSSIGSIIAVKPSRLGIKVVRAVRRKRLVFDFVGGSIALAPFAVFIVWDMRTLSHDEPIKVKISKTIRKDPVAVLSDAREELARMMKEDRCRYRKMEKMIVYSYARGGSRKDGLVSLHLLINPGTRPSEKLTPTRTLGLGSHS